MLSVLGVSSMWFGVDSVSAGPLYYVRTGTVNVGQPLSGEGGKGCCHVEGGLPEREFRNARTHPFARGNGEVKPAGVLGAGSPAYNSRD